MDKLLGNINNINDFFEVHKLILDNSKCDNNFYIYEKDPSKISHDDVINDSLRERIRRFNASTLHLLFAIERMVLFWNAHWQNDGMYENRVYNYRIACRDVCINIDMYVDKIKAFCRYYFYMSAKVVDDSKGWVKTLTMFKELNPLIFENFFNKCNELINNADYHFIHSIRNDEIHNESILDMKKYRFSDDVSNGLDIIDEGYKLQNCVIINKIHRVLPLLSDVRIALQEIVDSIRPHRIVMYISENEEKLKNIIMCDERYLKTKEEAEKYGI